MMAVEIGHAAELHRGKPRVLFEEDRADPVDISHYDVFTGTAALLDAQA